MNRSYRIGWLVFGLCAAAVFAVLVWISNTVLSLEEAKRRALNRAAHEERVRLALWRVDSSLLPFVARESGRPYFEYLPYYAEGRNYTRILSEIEAGEVLRPSPLLATKPRFVRLHFQYDATGTFTSPQLPAGNLRDLAEGTRLPLGSIELHDQHGLRVQELVRLDAVRHRVQEIEDREAALLGEPLATPSPQSVVFDQDIALQNRNEFAARAKGAYQAKKSAQVDAQNFVQVIEGNEADELDSVWVGSLVPLWLGENQEELFFFRRVRVGNDALLQGVYVDWPELKGALLTEVAELSLEADLQAIPVPEENPPHGLACIPAALAVPAPSFAATRWLTPARATLGVSWLAVSITLVVVGLTLRRSIEFGERRSRFASAVTHELRTPLTTFQMYSEMLADGMVQDPAQRQQYLETLSRESRRLSTLVENVLSYARVEDGRRTRRTERGSVVQIIDRFAPELARRAEESGLRWNYTRAAEAEVDVDVDADAVGQILFNLVDNACKYAQGGDDPAIDLTVQVEDRRVLLLVHDHGPGINTSEAQRIFSPFERASRNDDPAPGIGLGLALARELARNMGGDLLLQRADGDGACFALALPVAG